MMMSTLTRCTLSVAMVALTAVATADPIPPEAVSYEGSLSVGDGGDGHLVATGIWDDDDTTISWVIDNTTTPGKWHYSYTVSVDEGAVSHFIIEVSDDDPGPSPVAGRQPRRPASHRGRHAPARRTGRLGRARHQSP
ncbi:hypothetical protein LCGC14_2879220 [marine sediment metagenome]|uniref:Uncharacterized protein n=1 Tax=marine sediment metagenome TaxID=412755 RepID=A0A0F9ART7_9ZZZZ